MTSLRHKAEPETPRSAADLALDAAREAILAVGWSRTTLTDIARRAGVSRMTIYRKWPDTGALLGDLMTREWSDLIQVDHTDGTELERLVRGGVATVRAVRANPLFARMPISSPAACGAFCVSAAIEARCRAPRDHTTRIAHARA